MIRHRYLAFGAAGAAAVVISGGIALARPHSATVSGPAVARVLPTDLADVCGSPSSGFARFWQLSAGFPTDYSGVVHVGAATVPALSMYVSDGNPGRGVLCVTATARLGRQEPIRAAAVARPGDIAYLGVDQDCPYGAVRPGVARVSISVAGSTQAQVFTLDGQDEQRLQDLADGWHAFDSPYGYSLPATPDTLVVRAYDSAGHLLATNEAQAPQPAPSSSDRSGR